MKTGVDLIADERRRQVEVEGWTPEHDDAHPMGALAVAGACYAAIPGHTLYRVDTIPRQHQAGGANTDYVFQEMWPWDAGWDKRRRTKTLRRLQKAGALIAAEIDRYLRAHPAEGE